MESRPMPTGWQHSLRLHLPQQPTDEFTDPVRGLTELNDGFAFPVVEVIEVTEDGCTVLVSIFTPNNPPSPDEQAALGGTVAELRAAFGN